MFNKDETTYFEFTNSLNSQNFQLTGQVDVRKILEELKVKGKVCEQIRSDDDMCKSLGLKIIKNLFSVNSNNFEIYLFLSERYPYEVPVVYISESLVKTDNSSQEVFKYQITNQDEFKKDGKCNIVALLEKVQNEIIRKNNIKPKFLDDLAQLKETYDINTAFKSLSQLKVANLVRDTRNPSPAVISQQFKLTNEYLQAASFFSQLTSLNDRIIDYLKQKNSSIETQKTKNLHYCYEVEKIKKQFAAACCTLQSVKDRFSKLSVLGIMDDKITQLKARAEEIQRRPFSGEQFQSYKTVMKELKLLELKKEKMI